MKRRILIITNPGKVGSEYYCNGVYRDMENYTSFFQSGYGGYYSDSEIRPMDKPSKTEVLDEISKLSSDGIEFSIIIFCGHGWFSTESNSNIYELNDSGEEIDSLDLRAGAKKRIIIEDNCRVPRAEYITESLRKGFSSLTFSEQYKQRINPDECKKYYNQTISECPKQLIVAHACSIGETAGDDSSLGGHYSSSLLKQTMNTATNDLNSIDLTRDFKTYGFPLCHVNCIPLVKKRSGDTQNPQIVKHRFSDEKNYLPFAIIA